MELYTVDDASSNLGTYMPPSLIKDHFLKVGVSTIQDAGKGVFARETLFRNDIVTFLSGEIVKKAPADVREARPKSETQQILLYSRDRD